MSEMKISFPKIFEAEKCLSKAFGLIWSLGALHLKELANLCRSNLRPLGSSENKMKCKAGNLSLDYQINPIMNVVAVLCVLLLSQFLITLYSCHTWSSRFNFISCGGSSRLSLGWYSRCRVDWSNLWWFFCHAGTCTQKHVFTTHCRYLTRAQRNYNWNYEGYVQIKKQ